MRRASLRASVNEQSHVKARRLSCVWKLAISGIRLSIGDGKAMDDSDSGYFTPLHPTRLDLLELRSRSILKSRKRGRRAIAPDSPSRRRDLEECDSPSPLIYHENRSTTTTRYHRTDLISYQSVVEALNASYNSIWQTSPFTFLRSRLLEM